MADKLLQICGIFVIGVGLFSLFGGGHLSPMLLITAFVGGAVTVIVALLGYMGARQENAKLLKTYGGIMIGLLVSKLMVVAFSTMHAGHSLVSLPKQSDLKLIFDYYGENPTITDSVDQIQQKLACCGFEQPISMRRLDGTYPSSCCLLQHEECRVPFQNGCSSRIIKALSPVNTAIWTVFAVTLVVHILLIFMALYFASIVQRKTEAQELESLPQYNHLKH
ncbi:Tetraspanin family [Popillia japonica]|uniref:Tetraspanin family n=1 Tax=Popillia japonica TaxID=7064 RepID=A0AAW1JDI6_POPJA